MSVPIEQGPLHIALAIPNLAGGGAEPVVMRLARGLATRGHRVDIVMLTPQIGYSEFLPSSVRLFVLDGDSDRAKRILPVEFQDKFFPLNKLPSTRGTRWKVGARIMSMHRYHPRALLCLEDVRRIMDMGSYIKQEMPDCILPSLPKSKIGMLHAARLIPGSPPIIPIVHLKLRPYRATRAKYRLLFPHASHLVAVSQGLAASLTMLPNVHESKVSTIYNPVYSDEMSKIALKPPSHPWMNDGGPPIVLAAGRLSKQKDLPTLLRAFRHLADHRQLRLVILGDGRQRKNLENMIDKLGLGSMVSLPGRVDDPLSYMARAAVFVLSSRREGLPTVLIEALACGCPVVSTDCPYGPAEILEEGRWGELVSVGKDIELAEAIGRTLDSPLPRGVLQDRAKFFSVDNAVDRYEKLIVEVVNKARL